MNNRFKKKRKESKFMGALANEERSWGIGPDGIVVGPKVASGPLPTWDDLSNRGSKAVPDAVIEAESKKAGKFRSLPLFLLMLLFAMIGTLYVRHVYDAQKLLSHVQQLRKENIRLHLERNRLNAEYDRITEPQTLVEAAKRLGLVEGHHYADDILIPQSGLIP
ncbi:MAG TPA: hypothetical protein PLL64_07910 [Rhodothermales bacterium]|nr:hypothetical protein [Bacteroidota bacterium]HRK74185.1 hypothetical protein [Rhodothermales bacterium]HRR08423.1 hypothetical protein [Rhodothermales bacterium]